MKLIFMGNHCTVLLKWKCTQTQLLAEVVFFPVTIFTSGGSLYMVLCVCLLLIYFDVSTFFCLWLVRHEWLWLDEISGRMCTDVQYALLYRLYCLYASQLASVNTMTIASLILAIVGGTSPSKVPSRLAIIYLIYMFCCRI